MPEISPKAIHKAFANKDVKLNGKRVDVKATTIPGALVTLFVAPFEKRLPVPILFQDERIIVVSKPIGMSCENDIKGGKCVIDCVQDNVGGNVYLCHRLDNPTDGILLLAKDSHTQMLLQKAFFDRQVHKQYTCLVHHTPSPPHQCCYAHLQKDAKHSRVRIYAHETEYTKPICTEFTVLQAGDPCRLAISLHTGRTHQIRAHLSFLGHPLLGDDAYGDRNWNKQMKAKRLYLSATTLTFSLDPLHELAYLNEKVFTFSPEF